MRPPVPCHHCGRPIRAVPVAGHPYRHVETGEAACPPVTKAEPEPEVHWLSKLIRYGGGDSVLGYHETRDEAQAHVDEWNGRYQTNTAYVEQWDHTKANWPTAARRAYENGLIR